MRQMRSSAISGFPLFARFVISDKYASNQNSIVIDSRQVAANFEGVDGVGLLGPAFLYPDTVPATWANGTSGPTPQDALESFVRSLADRNRWIKYHNDLVSEESRAIPYVTLSNGKNADKKLRLWFQSGQHGDEPAVLKKIDLTILPRYNADGVEYFQRQLAANYDPNCDHTVLERQQTRAIRRAQSEFNPHIFVDNHEYTGVSPVVERYIRAQDLLVSANKNPNSNSNIRALNEEFVTNIFAATEAKGLRVGPYFTTSVANGTITIREPDWNAQTNHKGAGNYQALTFLVETRGIRLGNQHFQRRVASHIVTLETIINKAVDEFDSVYNTIETGRKAFTESQDDIMVLDDYPITNKSIQFINATSGALLNVTVRSQNSDPSEILITRPCPKAYLFSCAWADVAEHLRILGVNVDVLEQEYGGSVEALVIQTAEIARTKFEGIVATSVTTNTTRRAVRIPKGGFWVDIRQKNAGYAFLLLEPEGEASLARYNKVPVEVGDEYPIFRVV
ncbi:Zn-dependent exopeptidase [Setomelanomma holmii]|uniref:Zn-dependent exopeptidase n=1 Tax=Setomelanomma holmii TaxID=210430 RepID=A0A9P4LR35_9PLEO|nr:Zn-dependent exopeptidase [Setomelanomma holmii]